MSSRIRFLLPIFPTPPVPTGRFIYTLNITPMFTTKTIVPSLFWKFMERCGTSGVQFVTSIVLARLLLPEDFGLIALVMVFITLANVFVQNGFGTALIQKKDADDLDFSSVFYASLLIVAGLYAILFFTAPLVANFYDHPELTTIVRVLALTLFFGALNSIQEAYIARNMLFKKLFWRSLGALVPSAAIGITCALKGFGVWALVIQQLCDVFLMCVFMWFTVKWRPKFEFSLERVKGLLSFGWKFASAVLLNTLYANGLNLITGKIYSPTSLGYLSRGELFPLAIVANINTAIQSILFPTLSSVQTDVSAVKYMIRKTIVSSTFVIFPIMTILFVLAEPVVLVVLGEKWLPCVPFVRIFCFTYSLWPIHTSNLTAINAIGRSGMVLKQEIIKDLAGISIFIMFIINSESLVDAIQSYIPIAIIGLVVNMWPNKKLIGYGTWEQVKDIAPSFLLSCLTGIVVFFWSSLFDTPVLLVISSIFFGFVLFFIFSIILHLEGLNYLVQTYRDYKNGKR